MGGLVQLGNVPEWVQGAAEAGALYLAVRGRRQQQALDWAKTLKELSGLDDEELRHVVEDNPVVAEIVGRAWEAAAETASDDKRRLLAKVAAAAIRGGGAAEADEVDELPFLLRTVIELEPLHVTLLVAIGPGRDTYDGGVSNWPSPHHIFTHALSTLERTGLARPPQKRGDGGVQPWSLTGYGRRLLAFLEETGEAQPPG